MPRKTPAQEALDALAVIQPADGAKAPRPMLYGPLVGARNGGLASRASNRVSGAAPLAGAYNGELSGRRYRGRS